MGFTTTDAYLDFHNEARRLAVCIRGLSLNAMADALEHFILHWTHCQIKSESGTKDQRFADLEAIIANQKTSIEALQYWNRTTRVEALRAAAKEIKRLGRGQVYLTAIDRLMAREQPAPAAPSQKTGEPAGQEE